MHWPRYFRNACKKVNKNGMQGQQALRLIRGTIGAIGLLSAAACWLVPGDCFVKVTGRVIAPSTAEVKSCSLELFVADGTYFYHSVVTGRFDVSMPVPPSPRQYYFQVKCPDAESIPKTKLITLGCATKNVDIGDIAVER